MRPEARRGPSLERYFAAIDATWPAERTIPLGPVTLRRTRDAGMRVSSASVSEGWAAADVTGAEEAMRAFGQTPAFAVRPGQQELDALLQTRRYRKCFEVVLMAAPIETVLARVRESAEHVVLSGLLLQAQRDLWLAGGHVLAPRLAVMERAAGPKAWLLGGVGNRPRGTGFVALSGRIAMLHALEVHARARRKGLGARLTGAAARWAREEGAAELALLVTAENAAARRLYEAMGMGFAGRYHYRMLA